MVQEQTFAWVEVPLGRGQPKWIQPVGATFQDYGERLAEFRAVASIGSVGDSFDEALAESVNGHYKSEPVWGPGDPGLWKTIQESELAYLGFYPRA